MASIVSHGTVQNQAGAQNVRGSQYFGPVYQTIQRTEDVSDPETDASLIIKKLAFPEMFDRESTIEQPYIDTCQWILDLEEYKEWSAKPVGLLWIKGKPGAGKSTLMLSLSIASREQEPHILQLEFFLSARGAALQQTPVGMMRSLMVQLLTGDPESCVRIIGEFRKRVRTFGNAEGPWEWKRQDLERLFSHALLKSAQRRQVTIFIDALDEAGHQPAQEIAQYFHQLNDRACSSSVAAKICISSRHYPVSSSAPGTEIWVERHNSDDIAAFVHGCLKLDQRIGDDMPDLEQWQTLAREVIEVSRGIFQWVRLIIPILLGYIDDGESPQDVRNWLKKVPRDLSDTYNYILRNVIQQRHRKMSYSLFQWVCLTQEPLSLSALRAALTTSVGTDVSIDTNERLRIRINALSGGLVEVVHQKDRRQDSDRSTVQVIHQSVEDYIHTKGLITLTSLQTDSSDTKKSPEMPRQLADVICQSHYTLYRSCLTYLKNVDLALIYQKYMLRYDEDMDRAERASEIRRQWPLLDYAFHNLVTHAQKSGDHLSQNLVQQLEILDEILPQWGIIHGVLGDSPKNWLCEGSSSLHFASVCGLAIFVDHITSNTGQTELRDGDGFTALHRATQLGHQQIVEALVTKKADVNAQTPSGSTPLILAAFRRQTSLLRWLLDHGANVNDRGSDSGSALYVAAEFGDPDLVRTLLDAGADVDLHGGLCGTALHAAVANNDVPIIRLLVGAGAKMQCYGRFGSPLHMAVSCRRPFEVLDTFLDAGFDVNGMWDFGYGPAAPIHLAVRLSDNARVIERLITAGADVNASGGEFGTALQAAVQASRNFSVVKQLLDAGADVRSKNGKHPSVLHAALSRRVRFTDSLERVRVLELLTAAGADVNARGDDYFAPLSVALKQNCRNLAKSLLGSGARLDPRCEEEELEQLQLLKESSHESPESILTDVRMRVRFN